MVAYHLRSRNIMKTFLELKCDPFTKASLSRKVLIGDGVANEVLLYLMYSSFSIPSTRFRTKPQRFKRIKYKSCE